MKGYMALVSVIIIFSLITTVSIAVTLSSIGEAYLTNDIYTSRQNHYYLDSCFQQAILRLATDYQLPNSVQLPDNINCTVTTESIVDDVYTFTVSLNQTNFPKLLRAEVSREDKVYVKKYNLEDY